MGKKSDGFWRDRIQASPPWAGDRLNKLRPVLAGLWVLTDPVCGRWASLLRAMPVIDWVLISHHHHNHNHNHNHLVCPTIQALVPARAARGRGRGLGQGHALVCRLSTVRHPKPAAHAH